MDRIACGSEFFCPIRHDLGVAEIAKRAEEPLRCFSHLAPGGIGIDFLEYFRYGAASADRHAKVVHVVWIGGRPDSIQFFPHLIHRIRTLTMLSRSAGR